MLIGRALAFATPLLIAASFAGLAAVANAQQVIELHSGNGSVWTQDSKISFLLGPANAPFDHVLNTDDFMQAKNGPGTYIQVADQSWIPLLPSDPSARWIATGPGDINPRIQAKDFVAGLSDSRARALLEACFGR